MGEPLSIAAGTAGIVSLGLQVCGGLITYCKAWRHHDKNIAEALERLTDLDLTFKALDEIIVVVETLDDDTTDSLRVARDKIYSCTANMNKLHSILVECESISQPAGVFDKIHNVRLRSTAFFNKDRFQGLRNSITDTQHKLGTAMEILRLRLAVGQAVTLEEVAKVHRDTANKIPATIEQTLVKHLDLYGRRLSALQQDVLNTSSRHAQIMQDVTHSISTLQFGMIQKPSLLGSVMKEERQMQFQHTTSQRRALQRCTCRAHFEYKPYGLSRSYGIGGIPTLARWNAATFSSPLIHHRDCVLFRESRETKQFGLRMSFSGPLLQGAIQAAMSMGHGSGGFSISPSLTFNYVISSDTGPFKLTNTHFRVCGVSVADLRATFELRRQQLLRLYQGGNASPGDVDEEGKTVMHKACEIFEFTILKSTETSDILGTYFQFLRDLYEFGVPLNSINGAGCTPLGLLIRSYHLHVDPDSRRQWIGYIIKMLDLGAELPLRTQKMSHFRRSDTIKFVLRFFESPDIAEAFCCNEISLAIIAKSQPWLIDAIRRHPESINHPNALGQTPLHLSICWPEGLQYLLEAGAIVDTFDDFGASPIFYAAFLFLHEPFTVLAETQCLLHTSSRKQEGWSEGTLLEHQIKWERFPYIERDIPEATTEKAEAILATTIRLVVERRRILEALVRTSLDGKDVERLQLSTETVLDRNATHAISMLRGRVDVPAWLTNLTRENATVYHMQYLTLRQAQFLWDAGFRETDKLDEWGLCPLMYCSELDLGFTSFDQWELVAWLVGIGADLYRWQQYTNHKRMAKDDDYPSNDGYGQIQLSNRASSTTALHYLASHWARWISHGGGRMVEALSEQARCVQRHVLTEALPDCCSCACSIIGCMPYTLMAKYPVMLARHETYIPITYVRSRVLRITQAVAQYLEIDQPSLAWLRCEMIRLNTFEKLELHHTCCETNWLRTHAGYRNFIFERYGDEEKIEINEEQTEQLKKLETWLVEFNEKLDESASTFCEFLEGYWTDRMNEVLSEEVSIDHEVLEDMGIILREASTGSSQSSDDGWGSLRSVSGEP